MTGMTNQQAALIAAASQVSIGWDNQTGPDGTVTLQLARKYVTWLDQVDEVSVRLSKDREGD